MTQFAVVLTVPDSLSDDIDEACRTANEVLACGPFEITVRPLSEVIAS